MHDGQRETKLWTWIGIALGAVSFVVGLAATSPDLDVSTGVALLLLTVAVGFPLVWYGRLHKSRERPPPTKVFQPFRELHADKAWQRPAEVERICAAIRSKRLTVPLVVGDSGVGKTTLLSVLVKSELTPPSAGPGMRYEMLDTYPALRNDLERKLRSARDRAPAVIVLDQFEQWLALIQTLSPHAKVEAQDWLNGILQTARDSSDHTIVLSIRSEWYYDLRFLGELLPAPRDACNIEGAPADDGSDEMLDGMLADFQRVVHDESFAHGVVARLGAGGRLSPVEAQIVGASLERLRQRPERSGLAHNLKSFDRSGGVHSAIDSFFEATLRGVSKHDQDVCLKVLCALSIQTRFRQQMDRTRLDAILFEDGDAVDRAVRYLLVEGLLVERSTGMLDLAHDFLAYYFHRQSGAMLNPVERDNIFFHAQTAPTTQSRAVVGEERRRLGRFVAASLGGLMVLRLFAFGIDWSLIGPHLYRPVFGPMIDASYIPVIVAMSGWVLYVALMYDGVLRKLHETGVARLLSLFAVANLIVCVVITVVCSSLWIIAIALGGVPVAIKLLSLSRRNDVNSTARHHLRAWGTIVMFLSLLIGLLGAAQFYIATTDVPSPIGEEIWLIVNVVAGALLLVASLLLAPVQVSRSGISQITGLIARPHVLPPADMAVPPAGGVNL
jgi:hypothetical protein